MKESTAGTQQDHADDGAHLEILLADHLLVDVGREHVVLAADHLRHAEIGDDQGEDDEDRGDQAVAHARQRHRQEDAPPAGVQRRRRFVEPRVGSASAVVRMISACGKVQNTSPMTMPIGP